ncbi:agmatine deiminase family protein [Stieleria varia]|uniref:Peptidylarginine deiminase n=2 Tax=Stieleria varia TaxID=2528005 RepID=A0A5C6B8X5_9BACT|nr:agmatine deiminase family protein [Stieleria varia]TWU08533.1 Peptidylarginine deiminase precursor [Stieleria varia]
MHLSVIFQRLFSRLLATACLCSVLSSAWAQSQRTTVSTSTSSESTQLTPIRLPGEFEPQRAVLLSISDWQPHHFPVLTQIAEKTAGQVNLLILYNDLKQLSPAIVALARTGLPLSHVYFSPMELDTIWMRDYGPRLAATDDGCLSIDFFYEGSRPRDDKMPVTWASATSVPMRTVRWTVQGGNLIFNGQGLGVTSTRIFEDNYIRFPHQSRPFDPELERRNMVTSEFKRACNLSELVVLEPLQNEITKHVDMFLTFLDKDHVLVGELDRFRDPINAAILDRNAQRLGQVTVEGKPLRVSRIPMPTRDGTQWSSYTNIIMAGNLILMSTFDSDPPDVLAAAKATYERLAPGKVVETVDLTSMKALQGSLHCLSMNMPEFAPWPKLVYSYESFRTQVPQEIIDAK